MLTPHTHTPPTHSSTAWVFNNIWKRWSSIARRHAATKSSVSATLSAQFSGYGANAQLVNRALDVMSVRCVFVLSGCLLTDWLAGWP